MTSTPRELDPTPLTAPLREPQGFVDL